MYSLQNNDIAHIAVQLQPNDRFSKCVFFINYINCTAVDGWKKCTEGVAVATQFVQKLCYSGAVCCAVQQ